MKIIDIFVSCVYLRTRCFRKKYSHQLFGGGVWGVVWEGAVPPLQKNFQHFSLKMVHFGIYSDTITHAVHKAYRAS